MQLTSADICFDRQVKTNEALQRVVAALTHAGHTRADYLKECASLGQSAPIWATALPFLHGTPQSRDVIAKNRR